ncbi:MAG: hypothetical protein NTZ75_09090 [Euryarchaeota archaeon]|nr:hypothetical protein [Euryarchaeota archaeon]
MAKITISVIALIVISAGLLSGCTQNSNTGLEHSEDIYYIIGTWVNVTNLINSSGVNESFMSVYNFTDNIFNYSYYAIIGSSPYYAHTVGTYELKDGNLILTNTTMVPPQNATFKYSFSNNYKNLTLTATSGFSLVYMKL